MSTPSLFSVATLQRLMVGIFLEFSPIFIFLVSFQYFHIYKATTFLIIATIISTIVTYRFQKRLPYVAMYVAILTIAFGYLTLTLQEPKFIQMRDTLYDLTCAATLLIGLMFNIPFLKHAFHKVIPMTNQAWRTLTYAWISFFVTIAILNEYVRRTYSLQDWFDFKSAIVLVTVVFGFTALYFCYEKDYTRKEL